MVYEGGKNLIDLKLLDTDEDNKPTISFQYEYRKDDFLEALLSADELDDFFHDFQNSGKRIFRDILKDTRGVTINFIYYALYFREREVI